MNDRTPPFDPAEAEDPDQWLVSAVLDGEATGTDVTRVEADPDLTARLVELRDLRDQHRSLAEAEVAPLLSGTDARIAAALAGGVIEPASTTPDRAAAPAPTPIAPARRSARRGRALPVLAGVAAALVLIVLGTAVVRSTGNSGGTDAASNAAGSASQERDDAGLSAPTSGDQDVGKKSGGEQGVAEDEDERGADSASPLRSSTTVASPMPPAPTAAAQAPPGGVVDLGSFATIGELRAAALGAGLGRVDPAAVACPLPGPSDGVGIASLDQERVVVVVDGATGTRGRSVTVIALRTCETVG